MRRIIKIIVLALAVIFIAIQFVRIDRTNPPVDPKMSIEAQMNVPADVQMLLARSCSDCHSNKTVYPWYTQVAPVSWWLREHIDDGRRHLNFSEWGKYDADKRTRKLEEICEEIRSHAMPLPSYLWMHDSVLSDTEIDAICKWTSNAQ
ncbi:MAG: heme-binding domain-containing protein [Pyrinomonadaceae bacterium]